MSDASHQKWTWALKAYKDWQTERNVSISKDPDSDQLLMDTSVGKMSDEKLDNILGRFVVKEETLTGKNTQERLFMK
ncbi:Hypothetical predicted protein [Paramuricea clavata]|uniref:Uncharacterized protein n=1 Tax=Paramuricea clavata TaxID=317549 RepID=A0A6S7HZ65_PARCT|nr:Hypothetical predicted protein [Paramuricea clavata]